MPDNDNHVAAIYHCFVDNDGGDHDDLDAACVDYLRARGYIVRTVPDDLNAALDTLDSADAARDDDAFQHVYDYVVKHARHYYHGAPPDAFDAARRALVAYDDDHRRPRALPRGHPL
jgi:hypothetical protein